jgi:hypothetical protein
MILHSDRATKDTQLQYVPHVHCSRISVLPEPDYNLVDNSGMELILIEIFLLVDRRLQQNSIP